MTTIRGIMVVNTLYRKCMFLRVIIIIIIIRNAYIAHFSTASTHNALYKTNKHIYTIESNK